jgi:hypothetical protein
VPGSHPIGGGARCRAAVTSGAHGAGQPSHRGGARCRAAIDKVREVEEHTQGATRADMTALTAEVRALRAELAEPEPVI